MLFHSNYFVACLALVIPSFQDCDLDLDVETEVDVDVETDDGDVDVDVDVDIEIEVDIDVDEDDKKDDDHDDDPKCDPEHTIAIKKLEGLKKIIVWERSGGLAPDPKTFELDDPMDAMELETRLPGTLGSSNNDFTGTSTEFYDVFYSDKWGTPDPWGRYLAIEADFREKLPAGGGLNVARVDLVFEDNTEEFGDRLGKVLGLGDNYIVGSEEFAIDMGPTSLDTHTTMGNNSDHPDKRLLVVVGFESSVDPKCPDEHDKPIP